MPDCWGTESSAIVGALGGALAMALCFMAVLCVKNRRMSRLRHLEAEMRVHAAKPRPTVNILNFSGDRPPLGLPGAPVAGVPAGVPAVPVVPLPWFDDLEVVSTRPMERLPVA